MAPEKETPGNPLWDSWADALKAAASPVSAYSAILEQWRTAAGAAGVSGAADRATKVEPSSPSAASGLLQTFLSGQQAMLRMTQLATEAALRTAATTTGGPTPDPEGLFKRYIEEFREKLGTNPALGGLELWLAGAAQYQSMAAPWVELMQRTFSVAEVMGSRGGAGDPLGEALERSFGVLADFPGLSQELPALLAEVTAALLTLASARENYRVIMAATWQRTFEEITREVLRRAADREPVETPGALLSLSTRVADRVFVETFSSERYIEAQERLSTALANQRQGERKVVDFFARSGHFPTRRDHEEALREINSLRRDVRALKRALRSSRAGGAVRTPDHPVNDRSGEPPAPAVSATQQGRNGRRENSGAAVPDPVKRRRNLPKAARSDQGQPKKKDHGK